MTIWWTIVAFISGSLMFSYWLGIAARKNIRTVGDGNPGAINLWKAAGFRYGVAGIALDFLKGYLPVALLTGSGAVGGYQMIPVAVAPVAGHAFSPFLKGSGGKAIAVAFGVWSGLTGFEVSLAYAVILAVLLIVARLSIGWKPTSAEADAAQVVFGMLLVSVYLYARGFAAPFLWSWLAIFLLLVYTHRSGLGLFWRKFVHSAEMRDRQP